MIVFNAADPIRFDNDFPVLNPTYNGQFKKVSGRVVYPLVYPLVYPRPISLCSTLPTTVDPGGSQVRKVGLTQWFTPARFPCAQPYLQRSIQEGLRSGWFTPLDGSDGFHGSELDV
jgi:hypothetical protein